MPVLAKGKTRTGRLWTYVRDDRPFGGPRSAGCGSSSTLPIAAPSIRSSISPVMPGLMQADAYAGFNRLYDARRKTGSDCRGGVLGPCAAQVLRPRAARQGADRHRGGRAHRCAVRHRARDQRAHARTAPRGARRAQPAARRRTGEPGCASNAPESQAKARSAKAIAYSLTRWVALTRFLDDGRICMSNNAAERQIRPIAIGRKNWTFAGSDEGGRRAAAIYTLIQTAKLNDVDPQAWLADVLARLQDHPAKRIDELLPWNWKRERDAKGRRVDCANHANHTPSTATSAAFTGCVHIVGIPVDFIEASGAS